MAWFRKKTTTTTNIPELQEYYANQQKESTGKAWLLAIGSLLVTVVVLVGAFFGGRWAYRQITKKDTPKKATIAQTTKSSTSSNSSNTKSSTPSSPSSSSNTPATNPPAGASTTPPATTTPAQGVATTQSAATNASAAAATTSSNLPDTGAGNTVALFIALIAISYMAHRNYTLRKLSK